MASEQAAAIVPVFTLPITTTTSTTTRSLLDTTPARTKSLKRNRVDRSTSPSNQLIARTASNVSPLSKSPRFGERFMPPFQTIPLTGAAAFDDERHKREEAQKSQSAGISENPSHKAMTALMAGGGVGMSKVQNPSDPTTSMSQGMSVAANAISIPSPRPSDERAEISPASITSLASLGSTAPTATANSTAVASPSDMSGGKEGESRDARPTSLGQLQAPMGEQLRAGSSYPPPFQGPTETANPHARGMSLPMPGQTQQVAPRSPSLKKHKCPYCETDFTRHHNLKSHLLTHSQEKPYLCQTCNMRFRRLHDLKRHMKLHTGERPHICPKCKRKFARGDALARHSKGQGGCAGRRASMGDFGEEDYEASSLSERVEEGMDGVMYSNGTTQANEADMTEEDRRRLSLPSIKAQHVASNHASQDSYSSRSRGPSTYPPAGPRLAQSPGGLYPPTAGGSSSSGGSVSHQNNHTSNMSIAQMPNAANGPILPPGGMTESPKPLSPSGMHGHQLGHDPIVNRQRSPSLTTQFQQTHFGRRQSGRGSPTGMPLPSPHTPSSHGPKLPAIVGLAPDSRYPPSNQSVQIGNGSSHSSSVHTPNTMFQPSLGSITIRGHQPSEHSDSSNNLFAGGERGVWQYVATLEEKVKQLSEKVLAMEQKEKNLEEKLQEERLSRLAEENASLRNQLNAAQRQAVHQVPFGHS